MSRFTDREVGRPLPGEVPSSAARTNAPWTRVDPGPLGLLNSVLSYLVAGRRHARGTGDYRTAVEVHEHAGRGSAAHTESALYELAAYRLVEAENDDAGEPRWRATAAGVDALARDARRA